MEREDEVRVIAYSLWEQEGCCDGHDCEHWLKAEVIREHNQKNRNDSTSSKDDRSKPKQATKQSGKRATAAKKR